MNAVLLDNTAEQLSRCNLVVLMILKVASVPPLISYASFCLVSEVCSWKKFQSCFYASF